MFQLAHCVEEAEFRVPADGSRRIEREWMAHQIETAVDFARDNRLLTWYLGGLNFQIEHHLFPKICHVHYPAISPIVEATCRAHGIRHTSHRTMRRALRSHVRWLRHLGRKAPLSRQPRLSRPPSAGLKLEVEPDPGRLRVRVAAIAREVGHALRPARSPRRSAPAP